MPYAKWFFAFFGVHFYHQLKHLLVDTKLTAPAVDLVKLIKLKL